MMKKKTKLKNEITDYHQLLSTVMPSLIGAGFTTPIKGRLVQGTLSLTTVAFYF